jgi:hypothetical protein
MKKLSFLYIFAILNFSSCATSRLNVINEINNENITKASVLDLAKSSYIRGCAENSEHYSFEQCVLKSKKHKEDIKQILDSNVK